MPDLDSVVDLNYQKIAQNGFNQAGSNLCNNCKYFNANNKLFKIETALTLFGLAIFGGSLLAPSFDLARQIASPTVVSLAGLFGAGFSFGAIKGLFVTYDHLEENAAAAKFHEGVAHSGFLSYSEGRKLDSTKEAPDPDNPYIIEYCDKCPQGVKRPILKSSFYRIRNLKT